MDRLGALEVKCAASILLHLAESTSLDSSLLYVILGHVETLLDRTQSICPQFHVISSLPFLLLLLVHFIDLKSNEADLGRFAETLCKATDWCLDDLTLDTSELAVAVMRVLGLLSLDLVRSLLEGQSISLTEVTFLSIDTSANVG